MDALSVHSTSSNGEGKENEPKQGEEGLCTRG